MPNLYISPEGRWNYEEQWGQRLRRVQDEEWLGEGGAHRGNGSNQIDKYYRHPEHGFFRIKSEAVAAGYEE